MKLTFWSPDAYAVSARAISLYSSYTLLQSYSACGWSLVTAFTSV